jgi:hypothetical protein
MKITDMIGMVHYETEIVISNSREGIVYQGEPDDMPAEFLNYRIVTLKAQEDKINIVATK